MPFLVAAVLAAHVQTTPALSQARPSYVLAVSWQPAFCETRPKVRECRTQHRRRADASQFSLHGLWPQPVGRTYCGVDPETVARDKSGRWRDLQMDRLSPQLWRRLKTAMPGTMSGLERHEWIKHGTCMAGADPRSYYEASLDLLDALNASPVRDLFARRVGESLTSREIRAAIDAAFGKGASDRVRIACKRDGHRRIIAELTIGLAGGIGEAPDLAALIAAAPRTEPGCPGGIVDPVGLQ